ncbi:hypothetical protein H6P81_012693 [Aristolochia fimbriata]|uniref:C2 domain-containing protein n=1 Tax=Aristolochia fimbriata TaxID=158543 RepID=A0AAV7ECI0_ARIFI|nr:hypothetical protein H6P81_012693 [Aristolochia fimbriata]
MAGIMGDGPAVLHLTVLSAQALKDFNFLGKTKTSAVAWVDPHHRRSTKTLHVSGRNPIWNQTLFFSLSERTLQDPNSQITVEVFCSSSSVVGSASLPLSAIQNDGGPSVPEFVPHAPTAPPLPEPVPFVRENSARNFLIGLFSGEAASG